MFKKLSILVLTLALASCAGFQFGSGKKAEDATALTLKPVSYAALSGWNADNQSQALLAFRKSCDVMTKRDPNAGVSPTAVAGRVADWLPACRAAMTTTAPRAFFETWFTPYEMDTPLGQNGLYTGYYESMLRGSLTRSARYNVPLYRTPKDLVMVDLGEFRPSMKGERIAGKIVGNKLKPYADRAAIDHGALAGQGLEIAYLDDPDAAFFLHIQGSGRILLEDGRQLRVGYDGQNGHVYNAIGRELIARGELSKENVSLQSIRQWLRQHPDQAAALRHKNPSYVFFKVLETTTGGPVGAQGIALTPARSLAVDPKYVPYGAPVFVNVQNPLDSKKIMQRLMVAQDTGGAIRGPVRGDMFWGSGPQAEQVAGVMKSRGRAWILLPKTLRGVQGVAY